MKRGWRNDPLRQAWLLQCRPIPNLRNGCAMPQVIIPPVIADADLLFDEVETREILTFFWAHLTTQINNMTTTNEVRRFAQSLLIAAIDASYAMGYVDILFTTVANPRGGLKKMGQKLAKQFVSYWWKHAQQKDLQSAKIYESVRRTVSHNFAGPFQVLLVENSACVRLAPFYIFAGNPMRVWV
jgi:hypothetical protein